MVFNTMIGISLIACLVITTGSSHIFKTEYLSNDQWLNSIVEVDGRRFASEDLAERVISEDTRWHYTPWMPIRTVLIDGIQNEADCRNESSAESFPDGLLTDDQRRHGGVILNAIIGIYSFTLLALVCNDYFLPSVESICEQLNIPKNVAAATFMAVATSFPEFFVNVISTFISESDLGIGTIVGSALFNCLGVAAIGGIAAIYPIAIDSRPFTRDCIIYAVIVAGLVGIVWDGRIYWYEALVLVILYFAYFIFMFNSVKLFNKVERFIEKRKTNNEGDLNVAGDQNDEKKLGKMNHAFESDTNLPVIENGMTDKPKKLDVENGGNKGEIEEPQKIRKSLWRYPVEKSRGRRIWWVYTWPLKLLLTLTVPSPKTYRHLYPITFIMCIVWIGLNSYLISWMITLVGTTFNIADSIMGMTFLAFGGCVPEACSIYIMSRKGEGGMGVSNSLGANTLAVLFSLGIPWFIKTVISRARGEEGYLVVESGGIDYIIMGLFFAVLILWCILKAGRFFLNKCTGFSAMLAYLVLITLAILMELGIFFDVQMNDC